MSIAPYAEPESPIERLRHLLLLASVLAKDECVALGDFLAAAHAAWNRAYLQEEIPAWLLNTPTNARNLIALSQALREEIELAQRLNRQLMNLERRHTDLRHAMERVAAEHEEASGDIHHALAEDIAALELIDIDPAILNVAIELVKNAVADKAKEVIAEHETKQVK